MLEDFAKWGQKLANLVGDRTQFGVSQDVSDSSNMSEMLDHHSFTQLLHFDSYQPETNLYFNKQSKGFILEAYPLLGANEESINILTSLITDVLPLETDLQFILWASPKIGEVLNQFEAQRSQSGELYAWLAKKRTDYLRNGAFHTLTAQGNFILRDFRLFIVVSQKRSMKETECSHLLTLREDIISSLKSIQIPSTALQVEEVISIVTDMLRPNSSVNPTRQHWNPYESLSNQLCDPESRITVHKDRLEIESEEELWEARALTVKEYPQSMAQWKMMDAIGQLFNTSLQIPCPFVTTLNIRLIDHEKAVFNSQIKTMNKEKTANSPLAKWMPKISKEYEDWSFVQQRIAEGDKLVKAYYQVIMFAKSDEANAAERKVRDLYRANGWRLKKTLYLQLQSYLAMLPMMMSEGLYADMKLLGRLVTMTAFNAVNIAPLQGEWKGSRTPSLILPGRRGQIAIWNAFDNMEGNYNVAIAAAPGKGKSVLMQENIVASLSAGDFVAAIDNGRSYEKTCKWFKGTYVEFNESTRISLNPFTFIKDFNSSLALLKPLFAAMAHPSTKSSDEEITWLEKAAKAAWDDKGNNATISTVSKWLASQKSDICKNLSHLLYSYTGDGMYSRFFEGNSNIDLNNQFVVLELQELKSKKDLERIILLLLMYQISERMYTGSREQRKSCYIDEAWDLFGGDNEGSAKFIEVGFRTARKFNANFITSVQSVNDYYKNAATITCFENSDTKIILGQNSETIDQLKKSERLPLDPYSERLFKSLKKADDYSECIIKSPSGLSVHRIILDPFSRILFSSKAEEFDAVNKLQAQGYSLTDAIEMIANKIQQGVRA